MRIISTEVVLACVVTTLVPVSALAHPAVVAGFTAAAAPTMEPSPIWENVVSVAGQFEGADDMVVDADGYAVVVGNLPIERDFYVVRFSPSGSLLWSRIIGGTGLDNASGVTVDAAGDVYLVGRSLSDDFPTVLPYQSSKNGPSDAILMKLAAEDGSTLFSTYFGGSRAEWGFDVELGSDGSIYITGQTDSLDLETENAVQDGLTLTQCFCDDAFVTRFSPQADAVLFSTYLGGAFDDQASEIEVDAVGNIYFAGRTRSDDFPTLNAVQPVMAGGDYDAFVASITADYVLGYSTFLGGEDWELLQGMDADDAGNVTLVGSTQSIYYPTTPGAFQEQFFGGINACEVPFGTDHNCFDMFATRMTPDGFLAYSTFIGGSQVDEPRNVAVDHAGRAHVVGYTYSNDFPLEAPFGTVVAMRLNSDGSDIDYLISHDSPNVNSGSAIAVHRNNVFIAASSGTINGNQVTYDTYVAKYGYPSRSAVRRLNSDTP